MIIGLSGTKGSGKDTFFDVARNHMTNCDSVAFADPIKREVMNIFDLKTVQEYDQFKRTEVQFVVSGNVRRVPGREVVRGIGMKMRDYDSEQFNRYVESVVTSNDKHWFITDCRFDNELQLIKQLGGILIKIERGTSTDTHITEKVHPNEMYDFVLTNDGTLKDYETSLIDLLHEAGLT